MSEEEKPVENAPPKSTEEKPSDESVSEVDSGTKTLLSDETQGQETDKSESVVPDEYELKLPEDSRFDDARVDEIAGYAREQGLSNEQAQALLEREHGLVESFAEAFQQQQQEVFEGEIKAWEQETLSDPDIGGANIKVSSEKGRRVLKRFGTPELSRFINETGAGNKKEVIKFLVGIADAMADDELVTGSAPPKKRELSPQEKLYPNQG